MKKFFHPQDICRLLELSPAQIRRWSRMGLVPPAEEGKGGLSFSFQGLVAFRTLKNLLGRGIPLQRIRRGIRNMKSLLPEIEQPLAEMGVFLCREEIVFCRDRLRFTPDGQLLMDFEPHNGRLVPLPVDALEEIFFQALEKEEKEEWEEARRKYEAVLQLQPEHMDSLVNLGNAFYRMNRPLEAEACYRKALRIDPDHREANYNLANLFEEKGELENTILFYEKALHEDPDFADAHFNLARVLEKTGDRSGARPHWRRYLELDPASEWTVYVRQRLAEGEEG